MERLAAASLISGHSEGTMTYAEQRAASRGELAGRDHGCRGIDTLLGRASPTMAHSLA